MRWPLSWRKNLDHLVEENTRLRAKLHYEAGWLRPTDLGRVDTGNPRIEGEGT